MHQYLIEHMPLADISVLYQVKPATVRYLARKVEKEPGLLEELQADEDVRAARKEAIV